MKIAVYCGSDSGNNPEFTEAAKELGRWIGERGNTLVYGAGNAGLMGTIAGAVHDFGCEIIGVIPGDVDFIKNRPQPYVSELITTKNMSERKEKMLELADVFIALPGGTGTLDEISEAITLTKIGVFNKPCILFNRNGFYNSLKQLFDEMESAGFLTKEGMRHVLFSDNVEEIEKYITESN